MGQNAGGGAGAGLNHPLFASWILNGHGASVAAGGGARGVSVPSRGPRWAAQ